jgi:uncharacterized protein
MRLLSTGTSRGWVGPFGTDHPSLPLDRLLREWDDLGYSEDVMHKVFHANAERVLGL